MYLKSLELIGFKSFAERTRLEFEPGMTAIVGPNGCGKSNISDSIRWVLGEQSAKALRGSKMEDCIFNGTETHKPLSMAEVSITLADCEKTLGTEFNEVTVTRRVFRTGEGEYFINKTPCRLKDIQRLFMDTGVGTNSYSLMEQGRIDQILSSRPEDRREVFEEASGITKFKADKKEAIRKLDHTEANLVRLADIIREVRRQIISLQRQAGKAKRYKALQDQLRGFDIYATRERLNGLNQEVSTLESRLSSVSEQEEAVRVDVDQTEQQATKTRTELNTFEKQIADAMEAAVQAKNELDRARELIQINQDRIHELKDLSERDSRDCEEARNHLDQHRVSLQELLVQLQEVITARDVAERELQAQNEQLVKLDAELEQSRKNLHDLSTESVDLESRFSKLQNELYTLDAQERTSAIRKERLVAEQAELQKSVETYEGRQSEMSKSLQALQEEVEAVAHRIKDLTTQRGNKAQAISEIQKERSDFQARIAARKAQIELLSRSDARVEGFPGGARALLDPESEIDLDRAHILGSLAEQIQTDPPYRTAVEATLRAWLDAVVVTDDAYALEILQALQLRAEGAARMVALQCRAPAPGPFIDGPGERLIDHIQCSAEIRPLIERLLHNVRVVNELIEIPLPLRPDAIYVTRSGGLIRGNGSFELWMPGAGEVNPIARQNTLAEWAQELAGLEKQRGELDANLSILLSDEQTFNESIEQARAQLEETQKKLSQSEGESHIIAQEAAQARDRSETVAWELGVLKEQQVSGGGRRSSIHDEMEKVRTRQADVRSAIHTKTEALHTVEQARGERVTEVTDHRVRFAERRQQVEHISTRKEPLEARIKELESLVANRSDGISSYQTRIQELQVSTQATEAKLQPLQDEVSRLNEQLETARRLRSEKAAALASCDAVLHEKRSVLDELRAKKSHLDVELAEQRVRRQNLVERISTDYHITPEQMASEPEPAWENGQKPDRDTIETMVAEIRAKIEAMGPVNLVAIEEHRELEERFTFLSQQQDDLVKAKTQLMDLIRKINKTTTDMFFQTFQQVNTNFQNMFKSLFGGGSAKLVLVNEEDVLESGIEIIARPPGKKLQTVSLLSGGERTMTAVALLFSLYMVKPSPFCLLDELDAALDESNINRFIKVVQGFLENSQFVVITHNRQTISAAECLYGVTMQEHGVSKIVSVKFSQHEKKPAEAAQEPEPAAIAENVPADTEDEDGPEPSTVPVDAPTASEEPAAETPTPESEPVPDSPEPPAP